MTVTTLERPAARPVAARPPLDAPARQARTALYLGYTALPIIAGLDKFAHVLVDWNQYLAPAVPRLTGLTPDLFMRGVGVIEIIAGLLVGMKPKWGGLLVCAWLCGIIVNLLMIPGFYDVAARDFGLALGAFALSRLSSEWD